MSAVYFYARFRFPRYVAQTIVALTNPNKYFILACDYDNLFIAKYLLYYVNQEKQEDGYGLALNSQNIKLLKYFRKHSIKLDVCWQSDYLFID